MGRGPCSVNFVGIFVASALWLSWSSGASTAAAARRAGHGRDDTEAASAAPAPARERFVVVPFATPADARSLDHLRLALPALIAERLAAHPSLRFVGGPSLLADTAKGAAEGEAVRRAAIGQGTDWVVSGQVERRADRKVHVRVSMWPAGGGAEGPAGTAEAAGPSDVVAAKALEAALDAFRAAGRDAPAPLRARMGAPFARDPYAFVLYGRGVTAWVAAGAGSAGSDRAMELLRRSLIIDPKVPETRRFLAHAHLTAGRPGHARALLSYALECRPDYLAALKALAALDRSADLPIARERYAKVLVLDSGDVDARRVYGEILAESGALDEARIELARVVAAAPGDVRARRALALVHASRRAGAELSSELAEIVRLDPDDVEARVELGAAYSSIGKLDEALAAYEEVLRRRPRHPGTVKLVADLCLARGDLPRAAQHYEKLRRLSPEDPRPVFLMGAAFYEAGRLDQAERLFTEGARYQGMLGDAYSNLGAISFRRGRLREALWYLQRAAQRRAGKAGVRYNYALALHAAERHDDALGELRAAADLDPEDAGVRYLTGVVSLRMGRPGDAERAFREALRLDPAHEDARHNLALLESVLSSPSESPSMTFVRVKGKD